MPAVVPVLFVEPPVATAAQQQMPQPAQAGQQVVGDTSIDEAAQPESD